MMKRDSGSRASGGVPVLPAQQAASLARRSQGKSSRIVVPRRLRKDGVVAAAAAGAGSDRCLVREGRGGRGAAAGAPCLHSAAACVRPSVRRRRPLKPRPHIEAAQRSRRRSVGHFPLVLVLLSRLDRGRCGSDRRSVCSRLQCCLDLCIQQLWEGPCSCIAQGSGGGPVYAPHLLFVGRRRGQRAMAERPVHLRRSSRWTMGGNKGSGRNRLHRTIPRPSSLRTSFRCS